MSAKSMHGDPTFDKKLDRIVDASVKFADLASSVDKRAPQAMTLQVGAASGPLGALASMLRNEKCTKEHDVSRLTLFAGILLATMVEPTGDDGTGSITYSIEHIMRAFDTFERATGKQPDDILLPQLVEAVHQMRAQGSKVLEDFMSGRNSNSASKLN